MNYLSAILGIALLGAITTAAIFRGNAEDWKAQYTSLKDSYDHAAIIAKWDAYTREKRALENLQSQSSRAIKQAQDEKQQAQTELQRYQAKLKADAGMKDLGHVCGGVAIPKDLIP